MTIRITHFEIHGILIFYLVWQSGAEVTRVSDIRFPTSLTGDGSDAMSVLRVADPRVLHVLSNLRRWSNLQEHILRLFLCVRLAVHEFGSRRTWHDVHDRAWERHCESVFLCDPVRDSVESVAARERRTNRTCGDGGDSYP